MAHIRNRLKKQIGNLMAIVGIALILLGLFAYLIGPTKEGIVDQLYVNTANLSVPPTSFANTSYIDSLYSGPTIITNRSATVLVSANAVRQVQVYLLNSTEYEQINKTRVSAGNMASFALGANNRSFTPVFNATYYVFLRNCGNETLNCEVSINTNYSFQTFNYSSAMNGLLITVIGIVLFVISFALGNPLYKASYKAYSRPFFKGTSIYQVEKENSPAWTWVTLGCMLVFSIVIVCSLLAYLPGGIPVAILPLVIDTIIRIGVFFFLACLILFIVEILLTGLAYNFINGLVLYHFGVKKGRERNISLATAFAESWKSMFKKPIAIMLYCIIPILWLLLSQFISLQFSSLVIYLIVALVPTTLFLTYTLIANYRKIYSNPNDFRQERFFIYSGVMTGIVVSALFVLGWAFTWNVFLDKIYSVIVGSSNLSAGIPEVGGILSAVFSQIPVLISSMNHNLILIIEGVFIVSFAFTLSLNYVFAPMATYKSKIANVRLELSVFLAVFFIVQFITQQVSLSIISSLLTSTLSAFIRIMSKEILSPNKTCSNCKKELPSQKIDFCPIVVPN